MPGPLSMWRVDERCFQPKACQQHCHSPRASQSWRYQSGSAHSLPFAVLAGDDAKAVVLLTSPLPCAPVENLNAPFVASMTTLPDDGTYVVEFRTSAGEALCVRPSLIKQSGGQPRGVSPINGFYVISPEMLD